MGYSEKVKKLKRVSFDKLREISFKVLDKYSIPKKEKLFKKLHRGKAIIKKNILLHSYMFSYGNMHKAKLIEAFDKFVCQELDNKKIEIIDYGAGQALASFVFLEYIRDNDLYIRIKDITLIEPSKKAIKRGKLHLKSIDYSMNIYPIIKKINHINFDDLYTKRKKIKIHLFSNILDIKDINLNELYNKIINTQEGLNYFVCVSPCNDGSERIKKFYKKFKRDGLNVEKLLVYKNCGKNWWPNKTWTIKARVFSVEL